MKVLSLLALLVASTFAGTLQLITGVGTEDISSPRTTHVKLVQEQVLYKFDNNLIIGAGRLDGTPDVGVAQARTEGDIGYTKKIDNFIPYVLVGKGILNMNAKDYHYMSYVVGSNIILPYKITGNIQYRNRKDEIINWNTERYLVGATYNFNKQLGIGIDYSISNGSYMGKNYESIQKSIFLKYSF